MAIHMETAVGDCQFDLLNLVTTDSRGVMRNPASFLNVLTLDSNYSKLVSGDLHSVYLVRIA